MNSKKTIANISLSLIALVGILPAAIYSVKILLGQGVNAFSDSLYLTASPIVFALLFIVGIYLCMVLENSKKTILLIPLLSMAVLPLVSTNDPDNMPAGAVVAFNLPEGCPKNWQLFSSALGRTIVGAHLGEVETEAKSNRLTQHKLLESGGSETHKLSIQEMPKHNHKFRYQEGSEKKIWYNNRNTGRDKKLLADFHKKINTENTGTGVPHNNMQPFIALYYCQRM